MTNDSNNTNIVHESETQRRHSRVKLPSSLIVTSDNGQKARLPILDLSATGFAFSSDKVKFNVGEFSQGTLVFKFDSLEIGLDVKFQIVGVHEDKTTRYGCEFHELGREEIATLRTIITKFLSGEVTNVNDILSTLSRDNFAKQRQDAVSKALTGSEKFRALLFTAAFVFLSLLAFSYVLYSIHQNFFVVKATTAVVSSESNALVASRNGQFELLVDVGDTVSVGQPIGTIESPLLSDLSTVASAANMSENELNQLVERTISSAVLSPCDCVVASLEVTSGQFVTQAQSLVTLRGAQSPSSVLARFNFEDVTEVGIGTRVLIDLIDGSKPVEGKITMLTVPENITEEEHRVQTVLATIQPDTPLPATLSNHPAVVKVGDFVLE
ncbi:PilZ domain-containing protein [Alteromonas oceanisediminis]|uniref:PilZ domain-containing protein n=1 Tax=Alteromonas oceanisediminis TaxID=2836180 RepID=UPI001BDB33C4|nr:PilZ domain-containing protein [Alteromonas oceanisediminis]MBT0585625.1 PilZ domain-containing protein [Alteromonas oceanisediminis]